MYLEWIEINCLILKRVGILIWGIRTNYYDTSLETDLKTNKINMKNLWWVVFYEGRIVSDAKPYNNIHQHRPSIWVVFYEGKIISDANPYDNIHQHRPPLFHNSLPPKKKRKKKTPSKAYNKTHGETNRAHKTEQKQVAKFFIIHPSTRYLLFERFAVL